MLSLKGIWSDKNEFSKILVFLGVTIITWRTIGLISLLMIKPIFGLDLTTGQVVLSNLSNPVVLRVTKFLQFSQSVSFFIIPSLITGYLFSQDPAEFLKIRKGGDKINFILVACLMILAIPFINWMGMINQHVVLPASLHKLESWMRSYELEIGQLTKAFLNVGSFSGLLGNVILMALIPALGEELLFRGILQKLIGDLAKNKHFGIWMAAILFSAMHLQFYGFIPRMFLGAFFGYLLVWSGSLWLPILAHFVNNAVAVSADFFNKNNQANLPVDTVGTTTDQILLVILSIGACVGLTFYILKRQKSPALIQ